MREWGDSGGDSFQKLDEASVKLKACKQLFFGFLTDYFHSGIPTMKKRLKIVTHISHGVSLQSAVSK